jgi:hypothetical protein
MPFEQGEAIPFVQPDPPVRDFYLARVGCGGGPVNLVLLGLASAAVSRFALLRVSWKSVAFCAASRYVFLELSRASQARFHQVPRDTQRKPHALRLSAAKASQLLVGG